jgi:hypothetical protein
MASNGVISGRAAPFTPLLFRYRHRDIKNEGKSCDYAFCQTPAQVETGPHAASRTLPRSRSDRMINEVGRVLGEASNISAANLEKSVTFPKTGFSRDARPVRA